jgi:hypothetical protein
MRKGPWLSLITYNFDVSGRRLSVLVRHNTMHLDNMLRRVPYLWRYANLFRARFPGSGVYWDRRYAQGETSGSGSYGELATFRPEIHREHIAM